MNFHMLYIDPASRFSSFIPFIQISHAQGTLSWLTYTVLLPQLRLLWHPANFSFCFRYMDYTTYSVFPSLSGIPCIKHKQLLLTLFLMWSGITLTHVGGPIWPGWVLGTLKLSKDKLKPKNDLYLAFLIFRCLLTPKALLLSLCFW